ncbi:hypothetical protein [Streptomyces mayteni]
MSESGASSQEVNAPAEAAGEPGKEKLLRTCNGIGTIKPVLIKCRLIRKRPYRSRGDVVIDPYSLLLLGVGASVITRLGAAAAEIWTLRERARVAATLPEGAVLGEHSRDGATWFILLQGAEPARVKGNEVDQ